MVRTGHYVYADCTQRARAAMGSLRRARPEPQLPVAKDKIRKSIAIPKALAERIRRFRFARQFEEEAHAYQALLERGLEAFGEEDTIPPPKR
jgi:hypothetical protein